MTKYQQVVRTTTTALFVAVFLAPIRADAHDVVSRDSTTSESKRSRQHGELPHRLVTRTPA